MMYSKNGQPPRGASKETPRGVAPLGFWYLGILGV